MLTGLFVFIGLGAIASVLAYALLARDITRPDPVRSYDRGGDLVAGLTKVTNRTGRPEPVDRGASGHGSP